ncbi:MAG: chemotaxis protein CheB [Oligoflexus sp.]
MTVSQGKLKSIVLIGGSAGGIAVLHQICANLPGSLPYPLVIVQHLPKNPTVQLADLVRNWTPLPVFEVEAGCPIENGTIYLAPPDYHLLIENDEVFALNVDDPVHWSRPSIDVLFESAAYVYRHRVIAIVLTGANEDGATGSRKVSELGGTVIVQNPTTAEAKTMPRAALNLVPNALCMKTAEIAKFLTRLASQQCEIHLGRSE